MNKPKKIKILYIDDEINNLNAFKASFRFDYNITTAQSAKVAEEWLAYNEPEVILCDQRMPGKTGVEFFAGIASKYPKPMRILITGYTDMEFVIKSINLGHVFKYITKPWNEAEIRSSIEEANKFYLQNNELEKKVNELTVAYKELDNFAYSVSHDLKGPLMSIMGAMQIVNATDDKNDPTVNSMLGLIEKASERLSDFIQNMHDYYKTNRGQLKLEIVNLEEIKEELLSFHSLKCLHDKIKLTINCQGNTGEFKTDLTKLKVVANNLVANALKYQRADEDHKFVEANLTINNLELTIEVKDNGMGIEEKYLKNIFDLFFRATSEVSGSGFGLYNVKEIVTLLNGKIGVESKFGQGSTFTVVIPSK